MDMSKYNYVIGERNRLGFFYRISGDDLYSFTKKDCEYRIRSLFNAGKIDRGCRDYLLSDLKAIKRS